MTEVYSIVVELVPGEKDENIWSAFSINLPGACSQGDTVEEAISNVRDAITSCILSYIEDGEPVPIKERFRCSHSTLHYDLIVITVLVEDML